MAAGHAAHAQAPDTAVQQSLQMVSPRTQYLTCACAAKSQCAAERITTRTCIQQSNPQIVACHVFVYRHPHHKTEQTGSQRVSSQAQNPVASSFHRFPPSQCTPLLSQQLSLHLPCFQHRTYTPLHTHKHTPNKHTHPALHTPLTRAACVLQHPWCCA